MYDRTIDVCKLLILQLHGTVCKTCLIVHKARFTVTYSFLYSECYDYVVTKPCLSRLNEAMVSAMKRYGICRSHSNIRHGSVHHTGDDSL